MESNQTSLARTFLSAAFALGSAVLAILCALAGAQPGLLQEFYVIRVSIAKTVLKDFITATSGLSKVLGAALEELLQRVRVPEAICLYAVRYCSRYRLSDCSESRDCSSSEDLPSDSMARLQVALTVLYATSAGMACFATAMHLKCCPRSLRTSSFWTSVSLWIALVSISVASLVVTIIFCVVHMVVLVLTKNLPLAAVHLETGSRYLALTWASVIGMILALGVWRSWDQHTVGFFRHKNSSSS